MVLMKIMKYDIVSRILFSISFFLCEMGVKMFLVCIEVVWNVYSISVLLVKNLRIVRMNMFCLGFEVKLCIDVMIFECMMNVLISEKLKVMIVKRMV